MTEEKPVRTYQLCIERVETLEDVKKILNAMQLRMNTDNPLFEEISYYFSVEVVPQGYIKLLEAVGDEEIAKMTYEEMEQKISTLFTENDQTN